MHAMVLTGPQRFLRLTELSDPTPGPHDVLVQVGACAVCRTDLHIVDGELARPKLPLVPGHEIVGKVVARGPLVTDLAIGDRVGIPWLASTCGACRYCRSGQENLCDSARFTGYDVDGGYATMTVADARYCIPMPPSGATDAELAPFLCAGLIGYRAYRMIGDAPRVGLYGFGAAAHIIAQIAVTQGRKVYAFTRTGDDDAQALARDLGAVWAGSSEEPAPESLDACIIFAPVGALVPQALRATDKGGIVVCAGIHMSDIPGFPYRDLWGERVLRSVANLTRADAAGFFPLLSEIRVRAHTTSYRLDQANEALLALRTGTLTGVAVILPRVA